MALYPVHKSLCLLLSWLSPPQQTTLLDSWGSCSRTQIRRAYASDIRALTVIGWLSMLSPCDFVPVCTKELSSPNFPQAPMPSTWCTHGSISPQCDSCCLNPRASTLLTFGALLIYVCLHNCKWDLMLKKVPLIIATYTEKKWEKGLKAYMVKDFTIVGNFHNMDLYDPCNLHKVWSELMDVMAQRLHPWHHLHEQSYHVHWNNPLTHL